MRGREGSVPPMTGLSPVENQGFKSYPQSLARSGFAPPLAIRSRSRPGKGEGSGTRFDGEVDDW